MSNKRAGNERIDNLVIALENWFQGCESCLIAYSGGIDSTLVAFLARRYLGSERCLAVVGDSASLKQRDLQSAREFAAEHDIPLEIVQTCEMENPDYRVNPKDRCFHCKSELFTRLETIRKRVGFAMVLGGENQDDHSDYRPGLDAAAKFSVRGPLAECGVTKDELRIIARRFGLECWEKPASPCLSSRIPYFTEITPRKLEQIEAGETLLEERGFPVSRVRHHASFARIEVPPARLSDLLGQESDLADEFRNLGFDHIEIDPEGFVSGKLNREL
ncbi:MAG: ATP-dependent sacrificial sulfur transferase LarE [Gemmatimonadales bacterium]|nr:ATP-dependent sacrificial sulfur transferase LarE [Gemmatimonadales bacterium]